MTPTADAAGSAPFPETRHSVIDALRSADEPTRARAYDALSAAYWKPAYVYARLKWKLDHEDAADAVQEFFSRAFLKKVLERFDPGRARFRTYLRLCLDGFISNERKAASRLKRGGGVRMEPLDMPDADGEFRQREIPDRSDPDTVFHDEWVRQLFALALERLEAECTAAGKTLQFELFRACDLDPDGIASRPSYDALAGRFDLPVTQVTNFLAWTRRRFRALVLERLRALSANDAEYRADVRELLGIDPP